MRLLYVSGSSAGHLAPLVAVERAVKQIEPTSESLFVCSQTEDDAVFLANENVTYKALPLPRRPIRHPIAFLKSFREARNIINAFKPDAIFSKGGIVSIPICYVAHQKKIPIVLHESDAVMGRANRLVARWAEVVCTGLPLAASFELRAASVVNSSKLGALHSKLITTGNPIRPSITQGNREEGLKITSLTGQRPILLVIGGSQGAQVFNEVVTHHIDELLTMCDVVHLTGKGKRGAEPRVGYWSAEFVHDELPHLFAIADIALSRAGAGSITELASCGIPAVLVPIKGLANDHQTANATMAQDNGACILLLQCDLDQKLVSVIRDLVENPERREQISQKMTALFHPDAAGHISRIIIQCVAQERQTP